MQIIFQSKNQNEVFAILFYCWAYWWRAGLLGLLAIIPVTALYFSLIYNAPVSFVLYSFFFLSIFPVLFGIGTVVSLYLFKKLSFKTFKTLSVEWITEAPQSLFERSYLKKVAIYQGVITLSSLIASSSLFLLLIIQAFLFYLFIKNEWLPFRIIAKEEDESSIKNKP